MTERRAIRPEVDSFQGLWQGGYFEGNPLDPLSRSSYGPIGYMSVLHVTYLCCIRPYLNTGTVALEIAPGRGAWTKALLPARELWCLDALSAEHNHFWDYIGPQQHVIYHQVEDFVCAVLPDNHFNYAFSFGCFCHIPFASAVQYMENLYQKLTTGAHAFILISDYRKYNRALDEWARLSISRGLGGRRGLPSKVLWQMTGDRNRFPRRKADLDDLPRPGRWYDLGTDRFCDSLREIGYVVLDQDMGVNHRDPMVHVTKR